MSNIPQVNLTDTFNFQRNVVNQLVDNANNNPKPTEGNGIAVSNENAISVKKSGDGLSFDSAGNLVGNDAHSNIMTQVVLNSDLTVPSPSIVTETYIVFPAFDVIFDSKVYYGTKLEDFEKVHVDQTTMTVQVGVDGAVYVYVNNEGQILQTMDHISPANSSVQCLLGSYFRLSNKIQANSWKYTPWNGSTAKGARFLNPGSITGGLLRVATATTLSREEVSIIYEGVNVDTSIYTPNQISYAAENPYVTKKLWPGYDASVLDTYTLDTTHIYNMTNNTVDDISALEGYIVLIPGIVAPTGQDVYLMAMSNYADSTYDQIYSSIAEARDALYSMQLEFGNVASRVAWLGQSIIVKIGATNFLDEGQIKIIGSVPNIIHSYAALAGAGDGSRVTGLTIKNHGSVIGAPESKNTLNIGLGLSAESTAESEVNIGMTCITNCITAINENVKLDLDNGTLTLKKGSKLYVPNGGNYTPDGLSWTAVYGSGPAILSPGPLGDNSWNSICWDGSKFLALGVDGNLAYSTDGTTWSAYSTSLAYAERPYYFLTYGNGKYLTYNGSGSVSIYNSDSFVVSDYGTIPGLQTTVTTTYYGWFDEKGGINRYSTTNPLSVGDTLYVTDGTGFVPDSTVSAQDISSERYSRYPSIDEDVITTVTENVIGIVYNGVSFVALTDKGSISTSVTGSGNWSALVKPAALSNSTWVSFAYAKSMYVAISTQGHDTATSLDASNWTVSDTYASLREYSSFNIAGDGEKLLLLANNSDDSLKSWLFTSTDGTSWTGRASPLDRGTWSAICCNGINYTAITSEGCYGVSTATIEGKNFTEVVTENDISSNAFSDSVTRFVFIDINNNTMHAASAVFSGETAPTISGTGFWYDTTTNLIKRTLDSGSTWTTGYSFPICITTSVSGVATSIDQSFNSVGYLGSTIFSLPGTEYLLSDGRNNDGTVKNILATTSQLQVIDLPSSIVDSTITISADESGEVYLNYGNAWKVDDVQPANPQAGDIWYSPNLNKTSIYSVLGWSKQYRCILGIFYSSSSTVTDFNARPTIRVIDYSEVNIVPNYEPDLLDYKWSDHILNNTSWLRSDTFSWHSGETYREVYDHLLNSLGMQDVYGWADNSGQYSWWVFTLSPQPNVGDTLYTLATYNLYNNFKYVYANAYTITSVSENTITVSDNGTLHVCARDTRFDIKASTTITSENTEVFSDITIHYLTGSDGLRICPSNQESNVNTVYNSRGGGWYYILDIANKRFKLPRQRSTQIVRSYQDGYNWYRLYADGWVEQGGFATSSESGTTCNFPVAMVDNKYNAQVTVVENGSSNYSTAVRERATTYIKISTFNETRNCCWEVSGWSGFSSNNSVILEDQRYLYFYVGAFTKTALQNTAGINAEMFNDLNAHRVIAFQVPTASNNYTWYRKYADGWVEQGGHSAATSSSGVKTVSLPVTMADTNYFVQKNWYAKGTAYTNASYDATASVYTVSDKTTSSFTTYNLNGWDGFDWRVEGMAA